MNREEAIAAVLSAASLYREWTLPSANPSVVTAQEKWDAVEEAAQAVWDAAIASRSKVAPLSIDCDGCGQVVVIPLSGSVGCGCAGTSWSLTKARNPQ